MGKPATLSQHPQWAARLRRYWIPIAIVALFLLLIYLLLPSLTKYYLNRALEDIGNYRGHVDDIDLNLLRGAYAFEGVSVVKKDGRRDFPLFYAPKISLYLSWEALVHGAILAEVTLHDSELNFIDAYRKQDQQSGAGTNWLQTLEEIMPLTVHEFRVKNGAVNLKNFDTTPQVDLSFDHIDAYLTNLTNVKDSQGDRVANAKLRAHISGGAVAEAEAKLDPFEYQDFVFAASLKELKLTQLNDFARAYGGLDFKGGVGEVFVEIEGAGGEISGYIKPLFKHMNVASWEQDVEDHSDTPPQLIWEGAVGIFTMLFTNLQSEKIATEIKISGTLDDTNIGTGAAVLGLIKNAFVEAKEAGFEQTTPLTRDGDAN